MNENQLPMYWAEWNKARKALISLGSTAAEAEARRKRIHVHVGAVTPGHQPKSSKHLNNDNITACLKVFAALSDPANVQKQLDLVNQPVDVALFVCRALLDELDIAAPGREAYLDGLCRRALKRPLIDTGHADLSTMLACLTHTWQHKKGIHHTHRPKPAPAAEIPADEDPF